MENKHTPEPWTLNGKSIKRDYRQIGLTADAGETIASVMGGNTSGPHFVQSDDECEANARRIVACVNACAGISTENLEENLPVKELARRYNETLKQRDELLYALERIAAGPGDNRLLTAIQWAKDAIEKVKGTNNV